MLRHMLNLNCRFVIECARYKHPHLKIIASAGSPEKLDVLMEAGADVLFNYKTDDLSQVLAEHGPIDMCVYLLDEPYTYQSSSLSSYWDHVGGATLDATISHMNNFGLILVSFSAQFDLSQAWS